MNHRQLELVRSSYERIRRLRALFADLFNRRLLLMAPVLDRLLSPDPAQRDEDFLELVEQVVVGLDRLDVLLPALAAKARAFRQRGVELPDYDVVGVTLLWTVEQVLAGSPGAVAAWRETYELLAGVMKRAAAELGGPVLHVGGDPQTPAAGVRSARRFADTIPSWPPPPAPVSQRAPASQRASGRDSMPSI